MTHTATSAPTLPRRERLGRKTIVTLIVLTILAVTLTGYVYRYGQCDARSRFCVVDIVGTRSAVGFEWATPAFYVSTWPNG